MQFGNLSIPDPSTISELLCHLGSHNIPPSIGHYKKSSVNIGTRSGGKRKRRGRGRGR